MSSLKQRLEDEINSRKTIENLLLEKDLELKKLKHQLKNTSSSLPSLISHLTLPHYIKSIFENADELMWIIDTGSNLIACNNSYRDFIYSKYGEEPSINTTVHLKHSVDKQFKWNLYYKKALAGERCTAESSCVVKNKRLYFEYTFYPVYKEKLITGVFVFAKDITKPKRQELVREVLFNIAAKANRRIIDIAQLIRFMYQELKKVIELKEFYIALYHDEHNFIEFPYYVDETGVERHKESRKFGAAFTEYVIKSSKPLFANKKKLLDLAKKGLVELQGAIPKIYIGIPLKSEGKTVGTLAVQSFTNEKAYSSDDLELLKFASGQIAVTLERLSIQHSLIKSEEYFRALIENSSDIIVIIDKEGTISYISPSVLNILQIPSTHFIGKKIFEFVPLEDAGSLQEFYKSKLSAAGLIPYYEFKLRHKDGTWRIIGAVGNNLLHNSMVNAFIINGQDITHRKKAETELQLLNSAVVSVTDGIAILDARQEEKPIIYANPSFYEITGYTPVEVIGNSINFLEGKDTDMSKIKEITLALKANAHFEDEVLCYKKDGNSFWNFVTISPIVNKNQEVTHFVYVLKDITGRKVAEEMLKQKNEEMNTFVYKASHDMRGPLASIIGLANIASIEVKDEEAMTIINYISQSTKRLDSILNDLLEISRVTHTSVEVEKVNLKRLIEEVIASLRHADYSKDISFEVIYDVYELYSDRKIISSILQNLVDNAVKYKNNCTEKPFVRMRVKPHQKGILIEIKDNGIGIPEKLQPKIFDMFFRGSEYSKGTGLGLYIVKNSIKKLGGSIHVSSQERNGSTFNVYLPDLKFIKNIDKL